MWKCFANHKALCKYYANHENTFRFSYPKITVIAPLAGCMVKCGVPPQVIGVLVISGHKWQYNPGRKMNLGQKASFWLQITDLWLLATLWSSDSAELGQIFTHGVGGQISSTRLRLEERSLHWLGLEDQYISKENWNDFIGGKKKGWELYQGPPISWRVL